MTAADRRVRKSGPSRRTGFDLLETERGPEQTFKDRFKRLSKNINDLASVLLEPWKNLQQPSNCSLELPKRSTEECMTSHVWKPHSRFKEHPAIKGKHSDLPYNDPGPYTPPD